MDYGHCLIRTCNTPGIKSYIKLLITKLSDATSDIIYKTSITELRQFLDHKTDAKNGTLTSRLKFWSIVYSFPTHRIMSCKYNTSFYSS